MEKKKYYVVLKGKKTGIFNSWQECQKNVFGFSGAIYKSFDDLEEANKYLNSFSSNNNQNKSINNLMTNEQVNKDVKKFLQKGYTIAFVDGSYNHVIKRFGYGVVIFDLQDKKQLFKSYDYQQFLSSRNVSGEIFGVIAALNWCVLNQKTKIKIYYDYEGIERWFDKSWDAKTKIAKFYVNELDKIVNKFESILFFKVRAHSEIEYNEIADKLAKQSLNHK